MLFLVNDFRVEIEAGVGAEAEVCTRVGTQMQVEQREEVESELVFEAEARVVFGGVIAEAEIVF